MSPCVSSLLIHHGSHTIELHPHNRTIKFNSFVFSENHVNILSRIEKENFLINKGKGIIILIFIVSQTGRIIKFKNR